MGTVKVQPTVATHGPSAGEATSGQAGLGMSSCSFPWTEWDKLQWEGHNGKKEAKGPSVCGRDTLRGRCPAGEELCAQEVSCWVLQGVMC